MTTPDHAEGLAIMCGLAGIDAPVREHKFCKTRKWRLDLAWPEAKLAVEIEGGIWTKGRHIRPKGFLGDLEKYNTLSLHGWALLRVTPQQVRTGEALNLVEQWFGRGQANGAIDAV